MTRPAQRFDADLIGVTALLLLGVLVNFIPLPDPVRAVVLVPVVLFAPGYALGAAIFPSRRLGALERTVVTLALSVTAWAVLGSLLQIFLDLGRGTWLAIAAAVVLVGVCVAQARRDRVPLPARDRADWRDLDLLAAALAGLAALAIAGVALALASAGQHRELDRARFGAIWIAPALESHAPPGVEEVEIGVQNHEGEATEYVIRVSRLGHTLRKWEVDVADKRTWRTAFQTPIARGHLVAALYRDHVLERRVKLEPEAPA
jgi:uncharacterized membrane protein